MVPCPEDNKGKTMTPVDLKTTLNQILASVEMSIPMLMDMQARLNAVESVLSLIHPDTRRLLAETLHSEREKIRAALEEHQKQLALLRATVSKMVQ